MKVTEKIMGIAATIEVLDKISPQDTDNILELLHKTDSLFSTYKKDSEITKLNTRAIKQEDLSPYVKKVLKLCEETKLWTNGYFDAVYERHVDVSGLVTGWAVSEAATILLKKGYKNFYISVGNDLEIHGFKNRQKWKVGIQNPVTLAKPRILHLTDKAVSISGLTHQGLPIYNPVTKKAANTLSMVTVVAGNSLDADRLSTAAFAMGIRGLDFLMGCEGVDAYVIERDGTERMTDGFMSYM